MKKILFVGAESMPFAATGGLGDVMGSLPAALAKTGKVDVRVVMPFYSAIPAEWAEKAETVSTFSVNLAWRQQYCGVKSLVHNGVTYYFLDNRYYFFRDSLYGNYDDGERFAYFCRAAVEMLRHIGFYPDILHAHDWQAALSLVYLNRKYRGVSGYEHIRTVFTIHNIEYQGKYDFSILGDVFDLSEDDRDLMEYDGCINLMKAAISCADRVSTVSPRYAGEILNAEYAHGLEGILRENQGKLCGILNGIDYDYYNPQTDDALAMNYTWRSLGRKAQNKRALQRELGLPEREDIPMLSVISRLVAHKGLDLIVGMIRELVRTTDVQLVVLGKGDEQYESFFSSLEREFGDRVRAVLLYDRKIAKRIYAASDVFLMPSRSEPCGLSQMIASRYGAIPVVRETGGLYDSIKPYWEDGNTLMGNGFTFAGYRSEELFERTVAAISLWNDKEKRALLVKKIMRTDFSWDGSAEQYLALYQQV